MRSIEIDSLVTAGIILAGSLSFETFVFASVCPRAWVASETLVSCPEISNSSAKPPVFSPNPCSASLAKDCLISPISTKPMAFPIPVGSIPYSAGITHVTNTTTALMAAITVDLINFLEDGS